MIFPEGSQEAAGIDEVARRLWEDRDPMGQRKERILWRMWGPRGMEDEPLRVLRRKSATCVPIQLYPILLCGSRLVISPP